MPTHHGSISVPAALAGCLLALASCNPVPPGPSTPHLQIARVAELELVHTVYFDTAEDALRPGEASALRQFARTVDERMSLESIVIGHADVRANDAHNDALSYRRAVVVADVLAKEGVAPAQMTLHALGRRLPIAAVEEARSWELSRRVEIIARGVVVVEPNCPDWSRPSASHPANLPTSNFGCATAVNLGRMVADPRDLARGTPLDRPDTTRATDAVRRYRADDIKPLQVEASSR